MSVQRIAVIKDVFPLKSQFLRGEPVTIAVELHNKGLVRYEWQLLAIVSKWHEQLERQTISVTLNPEEQRIIQFELVGKNVDFQGYGVDVHLLSQGECIQIHSSSFDVVSNWRKSPRYGFLSDFGEEEALDRSDLEWMNKLHINMVQFYDWMYRHDQLISPKEQFSGVMGRQVNSNVVREKISLCHEYGMRAIAYGAVYAASKEFYEQHKDWGLYYHNGKAIDFIDRFHIMNIAADCPWHDHIIDQFQQAIVTFGFDGIHMDTYGEPKSAIGMYGGTKREIRLDEHFPDLIDHTRIALETKENDITLVFNHVGNWPVKSAATADQDVVYIEVWEPYEKYHHIREIIAWAQHVGKDKPVILAAYLKPFQNMEDEQLDKARTAALILTAVIASSGAYHLLLGEHKGILTQGYYVDYSTADEETMRQIRNYYDFNIRYAGLLYNPDLKDVTMTHLKGDNREYVLELEHVEYSTYGEPGKVWAIVREKSDCKTISLVNLTNNKEDYWNRGKNHPLEVKDIILKMRVEREIVTVFYATPDQHMGRPQILDYDWEDRGRETLLVVQLPVLDLWNLIVVSFK